MVVSREARRPKRATAISMLWAIPVLLVWTYLFWGWVFDDSYIAFRFSSNWAHGRGLTWNVGEDPVEGFTSFAWVLIGAVLEVALGIPPHVSMVFVGIVSWLVLMVLVLPALTRIVLSSPSTGGGARSRLASTVTLLGLLLNPFLGFAAFHGLETALHMLSLTLLVFFALRPVTVGVEAGLVLMSILSVMTRPDAVAFIVPLWGVLLAFDDSSSQRTRRVGGFLVFLAALIAYSAIKWWWFGYPFPNTFYVKQGGLLSGLTYVRAYLLALSPVWLFLAFAGGRAGVPALLRDRMLAVMIVPTTTFCLAYVKLDPTLGHGYRFLIPTLPLIVLACLRAYSLADAERPSQHVGGRSWPKPFTDTLAVYVLTLCLVSGVFAFQAYRYYGEWRLYFEWIEKALVGAGRDLARAGGLSPQPLLATGDAGAIPYFSQLRTVDIIGLADETVTHDGLTHEYITRRNPDLLILQDLYLSKIAQSRDGRSGACSDVRIEISGGSWTLDIGKYQRNGVCAAPSKAHSGAGSTFQVVTTPSFADKYNYVTEWDSLGTDRYYIFVRREYSQYDELVRIVNGLRWKSEPRQRG